MNNKTIPLKPKMLPVQDLFKNTFIFFKENIKEFLLITLATLLPVIIWEILMGKMINFTGDGMENKFIFIGAAALLIIIAVIAVLSILQQVILIKFINKKNDGEKILPRNLFVANKRQILSYIWMNILMAFILAIGMLAIILSMTFSKFLTAIIANNILRIAILVLFFIITLSIILYLIYLSISFLFSYFILLCEDIKGWEALIQSKRMTKNYWWPIILRLILLNIAIIAMTALVMALNHITSFIPVKEIFYSLVAAYYLIFTIFTIPFAVLYLYNIYSNLKTLKNGAI
ncbi:MAG: hypothetical protein V1860_03800 [bacterium]